MVAEKQTIDDAKLMELVGTVVNDLGSALSCALVVIGDKLGLYRAMANGTPITAADLANRTGASERYVRDWLVNQAAGGDLEFEPESGCYRPAARARRRPHR